MIEWLIGELGPWNWMVLGLALLAIEIVTPGFYLLWIGLAALVVGAISLALWDAAFWGWQVQVVAFLALSLVAAYAGYKLMGGRKTESDQPLLNRRGEQLVGRTAMLSEPIREGYGRIQLGDTMWRVSGPDLPAGARVKVVSVNDLELVVVAA
ncbi:NfeD family protein [Mesorhizobium sp. LHD-90]|uniref:NfeD family protein n=1 Tax=Mesorhizobium sp. LHD-90 TaxID=3071414 RepID=UPI0027DEC3E7|nr:NfeD family protein [Mesorhizobium sp. LHD-90]MDQ6433662.1 NfeD family protein [Mesorhizobium sp. LHD-90]